MGDFRYIAIDRNGKEVKGDIQGRDSQDAAGKVRGMGFFPVEVSAGGAAARPIADMMKRGAPKAEGDPSAEGKRIPRVQILLFTRELADLIDAGLPIDRALSVLIEQSDHASLQAMVRKLQADVRAGKPLSDALRNFPREFPALYANMIHAGEVSGELASVMARLAEFMEKEQVRRSQIMAALTYPSVLITVALLAVTFLLTFVIPRLQAVFKDLGADLPLPTQMLLGASGFIQNYWWAILLGGFLLATLFRGWANSVSGRRTVDTFRLSAPLLGALTKKITMSRYARTLGTLLGGGVAILDSMEISASAVGNAVTEAAILDSRDGVRQGETLSSSMARAGGFLPLIVHMSAVGEETGRLPAMLVRTSDTLDFEVDNALRRLTSLVEPLVVLLMGGFVGFVVLSILLPIFQANTIVK